MTSMYNHISQMEPLYPAEGHTGQAGAAERVMNEDRQTLRKLSE
jgi:hypothetical protein